MKKSDISPEQAMKQVQIIFKQMGKKAFEMAKKEALEQKIECKEAREALNYFITRYWRDYARPSLMSLVCEAAGGNPQSTTSVAVPMILISGAIDIHDDIIDQSKLKNGRLTVYGKYGRDIALLVGDALLFNGLTLLSKTEMNDLPIAKKSVVIDIVKNMFFELGDAETMETTLRRRLDVSPDYYMKIVYKKAADVEAHTRISALLGDAAETEVEALGRYGRLLGMLIILRDDWIDMIDLAEAKQRYRNESLPFPLLYAVQDPKTKREISSILKKGKLSTKDTQKVWEAAKKSRGMNRFMKTVNDLKRQAQIELVKIKNNTKDLQLLLEAMIPSIEMVESTTTSF